MKMTSKLPIQCGFGKNSSGVNGRPDFLLVVGIGDIVDAGKGTLKGGAARAEDSKFGRLGTGSDW